MNQALENNILKNNGFENKIKKGLSGPDKIKFATVTSIGITGLSALSLVASKSSAINNIVVSKLDTLIFGMSNIKFIGVLPIPNIVVFVLIMCLVGCFSLVITGNMEILLEKNSYKRGS